MIRGTLLGLLVVYLPVVPLPLAAAADDPPPPAATAPPATTPPPPPPPGAPPPPAPEPEAELDTMRISSSPTPATPSAPRALTMEDVTGVSDEMHIGRVRARYSLNYFGDVSLGIGKPRSPDHELGFVLGAQDFLIKGDLGSHFTTTAEIAMENDAGAVVTDIERFAVRWQADWFFIEAGRTHTAFGYWNNAYHHGRWLQPTFDRPRWVAFEDANGILPVHWVGINAGAKLKLDSSTVNIYASVGNGRGTIVDNVLATGDLRSAKALHGGIELIGINWPELRAGVAGIFDRIAGQAFRLPIPVDIDESIIGAYVAYPSYPLVFITEGYLVMHRAASMTWNTYGGFSLLGYAFGRFTPYAQFETIQHSGGTDPFFAYAGDAAAPEASTASFDSIAGLGGVRIDLSDWTAIKVEYRYTKFRDLNQTLQEGIANWSWGF